MKKWMLALTAAATVAGFSACTSMQVATPANFNKLPITESGTAVAHLTAQNSGWYMLWIPILTGDTDGKSFLVFNKDTVNTSAAMRMISRKAVEMKGSTLQDVNSSYGSFPFFPIPFLFSLKSVEVSASVTK